MSKIKIDSRVVFGEDNDCRSGIVQSLDKKGNCFVKINGAHYPVKVKVKDCKIFGEDE